MPAAAPSVSGAARRAEAAAPLPWALFLVAPLALVLLRPALAELVAIEGVAPDALLLLTAVGAWRLPPLTAVVFAVWLGCLFDLGSVTPWGLLAARLGLLSAVIASFRTLLWAEAPGSGWVAAAVLALGERCLAGGTLVLWIPTAELAVLLPRALGVAAYTALLAPLAFALADRLLPAPREGRS